MTEPIRAFLALELPETLRERLRQEQVVLRRELPRARWVRPEGMHATLKFLGETPREVLDDLARELGPRLELRGRIRLRVTGAGFFPSAARARVAWLGGEEHGAAEAATVIDEVAAGHGFAPERRPWSLHLTMARLDRPWPARDCDRFLRWGGSLELEPVVCREVVLYSSRLASGGAVYTALARFPLE